MSRNKDFSLFDFCKKKATTVELSEKETLDEDGNPIPILDQAALITHMLQLQNKGYRLPYATKAEFPLKNIERTWPFQEILVKQTNRYNHSYGTEERTPLHAGCRCGRHHRVSLRMA